MNLPCHVSKNIQYIWCFVSFEAPTGWNKVSERGQASTAAHSWWNDHTWCRISPTQISLLCSLNFFFFFIEDIRAHDLYSRLEKGTVSHHCGCQLQHNVRTCLNVKKPRQVVRPPQSPDFIFIARLILSHSSLPLLIVLYCPTRRSVVPFMFY